MDADDPGPPALPSAELPSTGRLANEAYLRKERRLDIAAYILATIGIVMLFVFTAMAAEEGLH